MARSPAARAEDWTYASGRAAAIEGQVLEREALERLAAADSPSALAAALAESPLRAAGLAEADGSASAAEAINSCYAAAGEALRQSCPDGTLADLFALPRTYAGLKSRLRAALAEAQGAPPDRAAGPDLLGELPADGEAAAALGLLAAVLAEDDRPEAPMALDLVLDSARLIEALRLAGALGSEEVGAHVRDEVGVRAALVLWRARLLAAQEAEGESSGLARWLPRLFLRGPLAAGPAGRLWALELPSWPPALAAELAPDLGGEAFGSGEEERLPGWELAAFRWLAARARRMRSAAFGVERVYSYAWALAAEERDVRLAAMARLRGLPAEQAAGLLWTERHG